MRGMPLEPTDVVNIDSVILSVALLLLVLISFNSRQLIRLLNSFFRELVSVHPNGTPAARVTQETHVMLLLLVLTSFLEGAVTYIPFTAMDTSTTSTSFFVLCALWLIFNVFSIASCAVVGYIFTSGSLALQWRRGLYASQSLLGLLLIVPAIIVLVRPSSAFVLFIIGACFYVLTRLMYISKGLRIFYNNYLSWVYFILYLCSLEIIPLLILFRSIPVFSQ